MSSKRIFIFAGEASGDLHGSELALALKKLDPNLYLEGVCGPLMKNKGIDQFLDLEEFQVMGFVDVFLTLPQLIKNFYKILNHLLKTSPDVIVLIDYQEFNLLLSSKLRKKGFKGKIIQYISPSVWAWRPNRAKTIEKNCDLLLTIYPFENKYYSHTTLKVKYIGNPVYNKILNHDYQYQWKEQFSFLEKPILSLFPGSRKTEILNNLPLQIKVLEETNGDYNYCISYQNEKSKEFIQKYLNSQSLKNVYVLIPSIFNYELMKESLLALAKSGTVTLELAFHKIPTVVTYKISKFHKFICKYLLRIKLPFYCIVNILGNQKIYSEFIESNINVKKLSEEVIDLLKNHEARKKIQSLCCQIEDELKVENSSLLAAKAILEI